MAIDPQDININEMTPEEFVGVVKSSTDDEIRATFRDVGTASALDRIFGMMSDYFRPERAEGVNATVQWRISDGAEDHPYVITFVDGTCEARRGTVDKPRTSVETDVARFARIVSGQANPVKLLMTRKLKSSGDVMFARKIDGFFDIPTG